MKVIKADDVQEVTSQNEQGTGQIDPKTVA